jgi:putative nucleotidyltransferase-like protein
VPDEPRFRDLIESLKKAAGALREAKIEFMLAGGLASSARGGPESEHDVDLLLRRDDADQALSVLEQAGFRPEKPPEGWLYKAWDGNVFIDLIFRSADGEVTDQQFERADELEVFAVPMLVEPLEDLLVMKLLALDEMDVDLKGTLQIARALREQIDWVDVRARTEESPYAKAFFTLLEELQIVEPSTTSAK